MTTRDFSNRKFEILPPTGNPLVNMISTYLPCKCVRMEAEGVKNYCNLRLEFLYKSGGVVVADGLGIAECFQQRVGLQDHVLDPLRVFAATRHLR